MSISAAAIKDFVANRFAEFGINKQRELSRLLYEIAKREQIDFRSLLSQVPESCVRFTQLKQYLLARRFPSLDSRPLKEHVALPELDISSQNRVRLNKPFRFQPHTLLIEQEVENSALSLRLRKRFSRAKIKIIQNYKEFVSAKRFTILDFNQRSQTIFVVKERFQFVSPCPCTSGAIRCGYQIATLGFGCPYECAYCFLQGYTNAPGIVLPANVDDFFTQLSQIKEPTRIGTGQFTDSLVLDHLTGYAKTVIDFLRTRQHLMFEFKTKSVNVDALLKIEPTPNAVIAWSVNPQKIIEENEFYTASLATRLTAARKCVKAGYPVAFHFDPIIYFAGAETEYARVVEQLFDQIPAEKIRWISMGTLRLTPQLKVVIENRFPHNKILDGEFILGYDNKLRYPEKNRITIYQKMLQSIRKRNTNVPVYLCMEEGRVHTAVGLQTGKRIKI